MTWRKSAGPPAASAPTAPARYAMALYLPNTRTRLAAGACPIMACSSDVMGPDSFGSVDRVPVSAATSSAGSHLVSANTAPATPMVARRATYRGRLPIRSPHRPTPIDDRAIPSSMAVNTRPTFASERPPEARADPIRMLPKPYVNARTPWTHRIRLRSRSTGVGPAAGTAGSTRPLIPVRPGWP